jgi:hypothetical protein
MPVAGRNFNDKNYDEGAGQKRRLRLFSLSDCLMVELLDG